MNWKKMSKWMISFVLALSTVLYNGEVFAEENTAENEPAVEETAETVSAEETVTETSAEEETLQEEEPAEETETPVITESPEPVEETEPTEEPEVLSEPTEEEEQEELSEEEFNTPEAEEVPENTGKPLPEESEADEAESFDAAYDILGYNITGTSVEADSYYANLTVAIDENVWPEGLYVFYVDADDSEKLDCETFSDQELQEKHLLSQYIAGYSDNETGVITLRAFLDGKEMYTEGSGLSPDKEYVYRIAHAEYVDWSNQYTFVTEAKTFHTKAGISESAITFGNPSHRLGYFTTSSEYDVFNPNHELILKYGIVTNDGKEYRHMDNLIDEQLQISLFCSSSAETVTPFALVYTGNKKETYIYGDTYQCNNPDFSEVTVSSTFTLAETSFAYMINLDKFFDEPVRPTIHYRKKGESEWINNYAYERYSLDPYEFDYVITNAVYKLCEDSLEPNTEYEYYGELRAPSYPVVYNGDDTFAVWTDGSPENPHTFTTGTDRELSEDLFEPDFYAALTELVGDENGQLTVSNLEKIYQMRINIDPSGTSQARGFYGSEFYDITLCMDKPIESLKGIEYLTNLRSLQASENDIKDVSSIKKLKFLESLSLYANDLTEMPDLSNMIFNTGNSLYASVYLDKNLIDPETVTADKLPSGIGNIAEFKDSIARNRREDEIEINQTGGYGAGQVSFYWSGKYSRTYDAVLTIKGKKLQFQNEGSFFEWFALDDYGIPVVFETPYTAHVEITDNFGKTVKSEDVQFTLRAKPVAVTSLILNKTSLTLSVGNTEQLTATIKPDNATYVPVWSSSDESVARVDENGKVFAVSPGTAIITAAAGSKRATCTVTVRGPAKVVGITLPETLVLRTGRTETLVPSIIPYDAANKNVSWRSSDSSVATVDENGTVTAVSEGTAEITVTTEEGSYEAVCVVTVAGMERVSTPGVFYYDNKGVFREMLGSETMVKGDLIYLKSDTSGSTIYYTTNGSDPRDPDSGVQVYTDPIPFNGEYYEHIWAYAIKDGYKDSELLEFRVYRNKEAWENPYGDVTAEDAASVNYQIPEGFWVAGIPESMDYTGKKITLSNLRVYDHTKLLSTKDYSVKYLNNINAGEATVTFTGKGNYTDSVTETFEITPRNFEETTADDLAVMETGKVLVPKPVVKYGRTALKLNKDYRVDVKDEIELKEPGVYTLVLTGLVNYSGTKEIRFTIGKKAETVLMSKAKVTPEIKNVEYTGEAFQPSATVKVGTTELIEGTDYDLTYRNNKEVGTATIVVTGKGDYAGVKTATFKITGIALSKAAVLTAAADTYTGEEIRTAAVTAKEGYEITESDYDIAYTKNVNAGTATVTVTGKGKYTGTLKKTFKISPVKITDTQITVSDADFSIKGAIPKVTVLFNEKELKAGKDYTVTYKNNKKPGTATAVIKGKGNFTGTDSTHTFTVRAAYIGKANLTVNDVTESNKAGKWVSKVTLKDADGGVLKAGTHYVKAVQYTYAEDAEVIYNGQIVYRMSGDTVDTKDIVPAGTTIRATVTGDGNYYTGTVSRVYKIISASESIAKAAVTVKDQTYTGKPVLVKKSDITVTLNNKKLNDNDYEIISYSANTNKGTASMVIKGCGSYGGTKTVKFKIVAKVLNAADSPFTK